MTKRRSYTAYNHFSKPPVEEPVSSEVIKEEKEKKEEIKKAPKKVLTGKVVNCSTVNVRVKPSMQSPIASVILKGETVTIDEKNSTSDFFAVVTNHNIDGFIVKNYIEINK